MNIVQMCFDIFLLWVYVSRLHSIREETHFDRSNVDCVIMFYNAPLVSLNAPEAAKERHGT